MKIGLRPKTRPAVNNAFNMVKRSRTCHSGPNEDQIEIYDTFSKTRLGKRVVFAHTVSVQMKSPENQMHHIDLNLICAV